MEQLHVIGFSRASWEKLRAYRRELMSLEDQAKAPPRSSTHSVILQLCPWHDSSPTRRDACGIKGHFFYCVKNCNRNLRSGLKKPLRRGNRKAGSSPWRENDSDPKILPERRRWYLTRSRDRISNSTNDRYEFEKETFLNSLDILDNISLNIIDIKKSNPSISTWILLGFSELSGVPSSPFAGRKRMFSQDRPCEPRKKWRNEDD